jgi:hypothetical protein
VVFPVPGNTVDQARHLLVLQQWLHWCHCVDVALLLLLMLLQLDAWIEEHEAAEAARLAAQQAAMAEDGWTVVTRTKVGWAHMSNVA